MIEINLLPGAKRKRGGVGFKLALPDLKAFTGAFKDPFLIACIVAWVVVLGAELPLWLSGKAKWEAASVGLLRAQAKQRRYKTELEIRRRYERQRDTIIVQTDVIREVDRDRYIWPHILDAVTQALPDYTWLRRLQARPVEGDSSAAVALQVEGLTVDLQGYTRFQRNLEDSPYLVNTEGGNTSLEALEGRQVYTFAITARYQPPDSAHVVMQPLSAALVQGGRAGGGRR